METLFAGPFPTVYFVCLLLGGNAPSVPAPVLLTESSEAHEALDVILAQVFNKDASTCISALSQLDEFIKDEEKVVLLGSRMDQLLTACYMQYRYFCFLSQNSCKFTLQWSRRKYLWRFIFMKKYIIMRTCQVISMKITSLKSSVDQEKLHCALLITLTSFIEYRFFKKGYFRKTDHFI